MPFRVKGLWPTASAPRVGVVGQEISKKETAMVTRATAPVQPQLEAITARAVCNDRHVDRDGVFVCTLLAPHPGIAHRGGVKEWSVAKEAVAS